MKNLNQEELEKVLEIEKKLHGKLISNVHINEFNDESCDKISDKIHQWDEFFLGDDENDKIIISECEKINDFKFLIQVTFSNGYKATTNICKPKNYNFYLLISDNGVYGGFLFKDVKSYLEHEILILKEYFEEYESLSDNDKELLKKYTDTKEHLDYHKSAYEYFKNKLKEVSK